MNVRDGQAEVSRGPTIPLTVSIPAILFLTVVAVFFTSGMGLTTRIGAAAAAVVVGSAWLLWVVRRPLTRLGAALETRSTLPLGGPREVMAVADGCRGLLMRVDELSGALEAPAKVLDKSVSGLATTAAEQTQTITRQAAALQETQVTVQEIKQTSLLAAQKAESVLRVTERADELCRIGDSAIEDTLQSLVALRSEAGTIAQKITELSERARQIEGITQTVKDLADQSNMLALNAAIEAVRSGEQGKGFGVVAREIRSLADQSIEATQQVRDILEDITGAITSTVGITHAGAERMESGLARMRATGETVRELSNIVRESSAAARQIAAAVNQQNVGITQIFTAVGDLSQMMEETVKRLNLTDEAVKSLRGLSQQMSARLPS